jgi:hypothetical protein
MAVLTTKRRKQLAAKVFGLPGQRRFPMPDPNHARLAKSGASRSLHAGTINSAEKAQIDRKADAILK